jgi:putative transposase
MINPKRKNLSINRQLKLVNLPVSTYYYSSKKRPESEKRKEFKDDITGLYTEQCRGYRPMHASLRQLGHQPGEKVVRNLMRELNLQGPYPKKNLSKPNDEHQKFPYLLRDLEITRIDQVWATDITYIKLEHGYAYLLAIIDLFSRKILSWRISNTMTTEFCLDALSEALDTYGHPEIFNTDQGSQFTSKEFIEMLGGNKDDSDIRISMDGKGRALDNIFIERFWRTIKYDYIFLHDLRTMGELNAGVSWFINYYNRRRPHQSLNSRTPDTIYFHSLWDKYSG